MCRTCRNALKRYLSFNERMYGNHFDRNAIIAHINENGIGDAGKCVLCARHYILGGNNPSPYKDTGRCCDYCNSNFVIPARYELVCTCPA